MDREFIDLKKNKKYIEQYIKLRNQYTDLLLTNKVNYEETLLWLNNNDIEIHGIVEDNILKGVVILYLKKENEVTFFAQEKGKGYGTILLEYIETIANKKRIKHLKAWVLENNLIARKVFEKNGYKKQYEASKIYNGKDYNGIIYIKEL